MNEKTLSRETALMALSALSSADALIDRKIGSHNLFRRMAISRMKEELGVDVVTEETQNKGCTK